MSEEFGVDSKDKFNEYALLREQYKRDLPKVEAAMKEYVKELGQVNEKGAKAVDTKDFKATLSPTITVKFDLEKSRKILRRLKLSRKVIKVKEVEVLDEAALDDLADAGKLTEKDLKRMSTVKEGTVFRCDRKKNA